MAITYLDTAAPACWPSAPMRRQVFPVVVRTEDDTHPGEACGPPGATEVVPEAIEGSLMLAGHALALVGVPMRRVLPGVASASSCWPAAPGYFHGADDDTVDERDQERLCPSPCPGPQRWRQPGVG